MRRELANRIRFFMDECLPPVLRDSRWFMYPFYWLAYRGHGVREAMDFKRHVGRMSPAEYREFYRNLRSISRARETDLNRACIEAAIAALPQGPATVADVGCGNGHLLRRIRGRRPDLELVGFDLLDEYPGEPGLRFAKAFATRLPLADHSVDVALCCHVLEHIPDARAAARELLRIARRKVIVVVPRQRAYRYTLDEHLHFFLYPEAVSDLFGLRDFRCVNLDGDWFFEGRVG